MMFLNIFNRNSCGYNIPKYCGELYRLRTGERIPLELRCTELGCSDSFTIGRAYGNSYNMPSQPCVSRTHARLSLHNNRLYITDLNSHNGTYLNGRRIRAFDLIGLLNGDIIDIAGEKFQYRK